MALVLATLEAGMLSALSATGAPTAADGAGAWADAYGDYAQQATAGAVPVTVPDTASREALAAALEALFGSASAGSAGAAAASIAAALASYWTAAVFAGMVSPPDTSLLVSTLTPSMTLILAGGSRTAPQAATALAGAFDTATRLVTVAFPAGVTSPLT